MPSRSTDNDSPTLFPLGTSRKSTRQRLWMTPKASDGKMALPRTKGRPPEMSTHLATQLKYGSSQAVSPARTSPLPVRERESGVVGRVFGLKCGALLGTYDPDTSSLKTLEQSLFGDLTESLVRLPRSGMTANGRIYEQATWVRRTAGNVSGLWRTPNATDGDHGGPNARDSKGGLHLTAQVKMWPTPHKNCSTGPGRQGREGGDNLQTAVNGQLNAVFVSWLMGYAENWTAMGPTGREPNGWVEEWPGVPRVIKGQKDRVNRLRCLGNAIVPQCAEMIFRAIRNCDD